MPLSPRPVHRPTIAHRRLAVALLAAGPVLGAAAQPARAALATAASVALESKALSDARTFAFVAHAGEPLVVLQNDVDRSYEGAALAGVARRLPGHAPATYAPLERSRLAADARVWLGRTLRLQDARGIVCDARVRELGVWTRIEDTVLGADGKPDRSFDHAALVARLDTLSGDCKTARFARDAALPAPVISTAEPAGVSAALRARALRAFASLRGYATIQKAYRADAPAPRARTWSADRSASTTVQRFRDRAGRTTLVSVYVAAGQGCGEWSGSLWALYELRKNGALTLRSLDDDSHAAPNAPAAILDLGDGRLSVLDGPRLWAHGRARTEIVRTMEKPYMGCGC